MRDKGYTLIELMIVLIVLSLLFSIGYAGYRDFSRRQALAGAAKILQGSVRKAQQNALSGIIPEGCGANTLDGYNIFVSQHGYETQAKCGATTVTTESVTLPDDITVTTLPSPNPILFKVLGLGTNIPSGSTTIILTQTSTLNTYTITIGSGGNIN